VQHRPRLLPAAPQTNLAICPTSVIDSIFPSSQRVSKVSTVPEEVVNESETNSGPEPEQGRWKRYEAALRSRATAVKADAEERRQDSRVYDTALRIYERNRLLPASLLVGAMASRIVVYLVPSLALLIVALGIYEDAGGAGTEAARNIADVFAEAVEDSTDFSDGFRFAALLATVFAAIYAANSLGRLVRRSTALIWGVPYARSPKPWAAPAGVIGASAFGWALMSIGSSSDEWSFDLLVGVSAVEFVVLVVLWLSISRVLPHDPAASRWSDFLPGSILVAFGVVGLRLAMVVYLVPQSADLSERYGSIGVALVMLTWAYWLGMIVVGSSELNSALFRSSREPAQKSARSKESD
jgi:uncharacterized BrkB/YihY/UPF0761 family membrane protein